MHLSMHLPSNVPLEWRRCRAERERDDLGRECAGGKGTRGDGERRERIEIELWLAA